MILRSPYPAVAIPNVPLTDFVLGRVATRGDHPALVDGLSGRRLTYGDLREQVRQLAAGLSRHINKDNVVTI